MIKTNQNIQTEKPKFDLEERTEIFFLRVIRLCQKIPVNPITSRPIEQAVGSAGSLGANYREATEAESKRDFLHKIKIARKEAKESKLWLKGLQVATNSADPEFALLIQEAQEFVFIFSSIINKAKKAEK
ncbi:four helix bundle protein [Candidatus Shapirobacteria bacterium]|nr:four helix bundle protein [Candidatus Shapirobacteria bacterium]